MALKQPLKPSYEAIEADLLNLRIEHANHFADVRRVLNWLNNPNRKRAVNAFTDGPERQLAYQFEGLLRGEFICKRCGLRKDSGAPQADF